MICTRRLLSRRHQREQQQHQHQQHQQQQRKAYQQPQSTMPDFLPADILYLVCCSGYANACKLRMVCLSVSNACREQSPWTLVAAPGLPLELLSWHLRGGDRLPLQQPGVTATATARAPVRAEDAAATTTTTGGGGGGEISGRDCDWVGHAASNAVAAVVGRSSGSKVSSHEKTADAIPGDGPSSGLKSTAPAATGERITEMTHPADATATATVTATVTTHVSRLSPRRLVQKVVVDRAFTLEGVVWPAGMTSLEVGEEGVGVSEVTDGGVRWGRVCAGGRVSASSITKTCTEAALAAFSAATAARFSKAIRAADDGNPAGSSATLTSQQQPEAKKPPAPTATEAFWAGRAGGTCYDRPIREVSLPPTLVHLELLGPFNDPLQGVEWPPALETLVFGELFNQSLSRDGDGENGDGGSGEGVLLPRGLKSLTLGSAFNQCLDDVAWPPGLAHLQLGHSFNQDIEGVRWPSTLREIYFGDLFRSPITQVRLAPACVCEHAGLEVSCSMVIFTYLARHPFCGFGSCGRRLSCFCLLKSFLPSYQ